MGFQSDVNSVFGSIMGLGLSRKLTDVAKDTKTVAEGANAINNLIGDMKAQADTPQLKYTVDTPQLGYKPRFNASAFTDPSVKSAPNVIYASYAKMNVAHQQHLKAMSKLSYPKDDDIKTVDVDKQTEFTRRYMDGFITSPILGDIMDSIDYEDRFSESRATDAALSLNDARNSRMRSKWAAENAAARNPDVVDSEYDAEADAHITKFDRDATNWAKYNSDWTYATKDWERKEWNAIVDMIRRRKGRHKR